jgi:hypothetical protein
MICNREQIIISNPYLPNWEYIPDGEPRVFGNRVYIYGSHDTACSDKFRDYKLKVRSASVDNLNQWVCRINGQWYTFYHRLTNGTIMSRRGCVIGYKYFDFGEDFPSLSMEFSVNVKGAGLNPKSVFLLTILKKAQKSEIAKLVWTTEFTM